MKALSLSPSSPPEAGTMELAFSKYPLLIHSFWIHVDALFDYKPQRGCGSRAGLLLSMFV